MEEKAVRGIRWTILGFGVYKAITFATTIVLARLLVPEDFGLMALAILAIGVLNLFSDFGFGSAQVVRQDLDRRAQGTVFTVILVTAAVVAALSAASSPVVAAIFDEPRVVPVLIVLAVHTVPTAVGWFYETLLQRELEFRGRFRARLVESLTWAGVTIGLAVAGAGVWSLVVGHIVSTTAYSVALVIVAPYRVRPRFDARTARDVFSTGRGFVVQAASAFLRQNVDTFAVGRIGAAALGFYSIAFRLGELPNAAIANPVAQATFPGFARLRARGEDVVRPFLAVLRLIALITFPIGLVLSGAARPFVELLYGDRWLPAVGPVAVLGLWAAVRPVEATIAWLLNSIGEPGVVGRVSMVLLVPLVPALLVAAHYGGITAVAWVMVGQLVASVVALVVLAARRAGVPIGSQWRAVRPLAMASVLAWGTTSLVARASADMGSVPALAVPVLAGVATYLAVVSLAEPPLLAEVVRRARRALGPAPADAPA